MASVVCAYVYVSPRCVDQDGPYGRHKRLMRALGAPCEDGWQWCNDYNPPLVHLGDEDLALFAPEALT